MLWPHIAGPKLRSMRPAHSTGLRMSYWAERMGMTEKQNETDGFNQPKYVGSTIFNQKKKMILAKKTRSNQTNVDCDTMNKCGDMTKHHARCLKIGYTSIPPKLPFK